MDQKSIDTLKHSFEELAKNYRSDELLIKKDGLHLPSRDAIISILSSLREVIFPGYFSNENITEESSDYYIGHTLIRTYDELRVQAETAFLYSGLESDKASARAECICTALLGKLPKIQQLLLKDVQAFYDGDPAAGSKEEVIFSYPGLYAIFVYRIAHELYDAKVPFIPRMMTEYAHGLTGIDINPGARIGEYFFIDHGTGIVIGETCEIGNNVKVYQGVTLGALSTKSGQLLSGKKRHPTIEDNVTIYSGATILGGNTVIGEDAVIGGNTFIIESIPPHTRVSIKKPELIMKDSDASGVVNELIL